MKIAITGSTGLVGRAFIDLYKEDYELIALGREDRETDILFGEYRKTDYSKESLVEVLRDANAVIHLAAKRTEKKEGSLLDYAANIQITENLYQTCRELNILNVVFASSISVYSRGNGNIWNENIRPIPLNMYGISKLICEKLGEYYSYKCGMHIKNLRIGQILSDKERPGFLVRTLFDNAKSGKSQTIYGSGNDKRIYIYVNDVARAFRLAVENSDKEGIYNIAGNEVLSVLELARIIDSVYSNAAQMLFVEGIDYSLMQDINLCNEKALAELHFAPQFSILNAVEDMYKRSNEVETI